MTDWSRLVDYITNYFPEPSYSTQDIKEWATKSVPAWKSMSNKDKSEVLGDWENFIAPQVEKWFTRMSKGFGSRIRKFLGRLY